jgi:hypothetical protein
LDWLGPGRTGPPGIFKIAAKEHERANEKPEESFFFHSIVLFAFFLGNSIGLDWLGLV